MNAARTEAVSLARTREWARRGREICPNGILPGRAPNVPRLRPCRDFSPRAERTRQGLAKVLSMRERAFEARSRICLRGLPLKW